MTRRGLHRCTGLAILVALPLLTAGCGDEQDALAPVRAQVETARESGAVALPAELPPDLEMAWATAGDGISSVSFYSTNEPIVMVCSGGAAACADVHPTSPQIRSAEVDGQEVVLLLGTREDPDEPGPRLDTRLDEFWSSVELTTGDPGWLADR